MSSLLQIVKAGFPRKILGKMHEGYIVYEGNRELCFVFKVGTNDWAVLKKLDLHLHAGKTREEAIKKILRRKS
jgi:hypothetical protein